LIDGLRVLGLIPARGGSKGLPRKNILELAGRPLIAWTLAAAKASAYLDRCIISTDDAEIAQVARRHGGDVPFLRPAELAGDAADTFGTVQHAVEQLPGYDILVLLQPTSPLRSADDIDATLERLQQHHAPACVSVVEPAKSPYWAYRIDPEHHLQPLIDPQYARMRRQDLPPSYLLNGAVYAARIDWLMAHRHWLGEQTVAHVMPAQRSLDIDSAFDLELAHCYLQARQGTERSAG
jgi:N-acylneuraminate cytidylyltransferase